MDLGLAARVAVVTGSSPGIGRAAALLFGSEGARVAVTYHREPDRALAVADEIENGGGEAVATELDLASAGSVSRAVGTALERWGQVDVLVNNAVYWGDRAPWEAPPFEELAAEKWRASGVAAGGLPGSTPYGAAKAALHGLTRTLSKELAPAGILVSVIMPSASGLSARLPGSPPGSSR